MGPMLAESEVRSPKGHADSGKLGGFVSARISSSSRWILLSWLTMAERNAYHVSVTTARLDRQLRGPAGSARRSTTALLVATLCLVALQYVPVHVLTEPHHHSHPASPEPAGATPEDSHHGSPDPDHGGPGRAALDHQSALPGCRVLHFGTDVAATTTFVLAPALAMRGTMDLVDVPVPPWPSRRPFAARGPPAAAHT